MIYCVLDVGVGHNRWHVMSTFEEMMYAPKVPGENVTIVERFEAGNRRLILWAKEHLNMSKLDPAIAKFFNEFE